MRVQGSTSTSGDDATGPDTGFRPQIAARRKPFYIGSDIYRNRAFGSNHPLSIVRHSAVTDVLRMLGWLDDSNFLDSKPATFAQLTEFHDRAYVRALQHANVSGKVEPEVRERYQIGTFENPLFPGLFDRAAMTVGGSILAARVALDDGVSFHPSGGTHHGRPDRASGFCYFNDPVFAIRTLLDGGIDHVLYVDLDAHHGDGVEDAFAGEERVSTFSIHEERRWPFSGSRSHAESGNFNLPVPKGFSDAEFRFLFEEALLPLIEARRPSALVLCCGADCLAGDPLSGMMLTNRVLWDAVAELLELGLPTVVLGGGGYNPWTVTRYWAGLWGTISGRSLPAQLPPQASEYLEKLECDLVDEDDMDPAWFTTLADADVPRGEVRGSVRRLLAGPEWRFGR